MKPYGRARAEVSRAFAQGDVRVAVYGLGKMGLPLAACFAQAGARVTGVDVDRAVVKAVAAGRCHVAGEPGLPEAVASAVREGTLTATTDGVAAARAADVHVILVPTLLTPRKRPDLRAVEAVAKTIARGIEPGSLVVQESTLPPGTTDGPLVSWLSGKRATPGRDVGLAFCPERTASGRALRDITESYPKVVGGLDEASAEAAAGIYEVVNKKGVLVVSSARVAEAVKVFEGVYRDVNIALANELAAYCEGIGIDAMEAIRAANTQPYSHLHTPGAGVGGHCIPVYPYFVMGRTPTPLLATARKVNDAMPAHAVLLLKEGLARHGRTLRGAKILLLGLAYRGGVAETRYSPGVRIGRILKASGARLSVHDPAVGPTAELRAPRGKPQEGGWDGIVVATDHAEYGALDWPGVVARMRTPVVVDGRRVVPQDAVRAAGGSYYAVGLPREAGP